MELLIIRTSAIGDVIHTLPAIFYLKKTIPKAQITWVVQEKAASLLKKQPFVKKLYILPNKFLKPKNLKQTLCVLRKLRKTQWDAIIDFQGLLKTSVILFSQRTFCNKFGFSKDHARESISSLFTKHHTKPAYTNIIQKNLALASDVTTNLTKSQTCPIIDETKKDFYLHFPEKTKNIVENWLKQTPSFTTTQKTNKIAIAPNTTWPSKHWPIEHWKDFLTNLNKRFRFYNRNNALQGAANATHEKRLTELYLLGEEFGESALALARHVKKHNLNVNIVPKWDLLTTAYFIKNVSLLIAPDTGLLHLADFLGTRTIGIFGPTLAKRHGPFLTEENVAAAIQIPCQHRYQKDHGKINCMQKLTPDQLCKIVLQQLNK